jgi:short-subunit dehydrogenase
MEHENKKYVCIYGWGVVLDSIYSQVVLAIGRKPDFICDRLPEKWGKTFHEIKCISPDELKKLAENVTVYVTVKHYTEINNFLKKLGVTDIYNILYKRDYNGVAAIRRPADSVIDPEPVLLSLEGKWALVTGASRGIGREITLRLIKEKVNIIAHCRSLDHLDEIREASKAHGVDIECLAADLSSISDLEKMLTKLEVLASKIDIVYNNAGISIPYYPEEPWNVPAEDFTRSYMVNCVAPVKICNKLLPFMLKRGSGRIVNLSSSISHRPKEMAYACSKAGLDKYVYDLTPTLKNSGVVITQLDPGWLKTDMGGKDAKQSVETVLPGALLGVVLNHDINGEWISAQDYSRMTLREAVKKAEYLLNLNKIDIER